MKKTSTFLLVALCMLAFNLSSNAQVTGTVFRDYNNSGTRETTNPNEPLATGIIVNAYNASDALVATITTSGTAAPNYSFPATGANSIASGLAVRLEFIIPAGFGIGGTGINGATANTSVRFVSGGAAAINVNFGVFNKNEYFQNNPKVVVPRYVRGTTAPLSTTAAVLHSFPYNYGIEKDGTTLSSAGVWTTAFEPPVGYRPDPSNEATQNEIGTVYGLGWKSSTKTLYMGSYLRRKAPLGPGGLGAIYQLTSPTGNVATNTPTVYANLNTLFANGPGGVLGFTRETNAAYDWNNDIGVKSLIGRRGLGDVEVNNNQDTIYTIGLNDRKLYAVPTSGAISAATIKSYDFITAITAISGVAAGQFANSEIHPFAIGINPRDNFVYIGGVYGDDGNVGVSVNIRMLVWRFDPTNGSITLVLNQFLGYGRSINFGFGYGAAAINVPALPPSGGGGVFQPWNDAFVEGVGTASALQQAMLTDIAFDGDAMVLGFRDRFGDQTPEAGVLPGGDPYTRGNGEIIRVANIAGTWTLEAAGVSKDGNTGANITGSTTANTGPGSGEFYYQEWASDGDIAEASMGALLMIPGKEHIMSTAFDPLKLNQNNQLVFSNVNANGVQTHSNVNGQIVGAYEVVTAGQGSAADAFAKANGIGDIEALIDAPTIELGNRVWNDINADGIQEPGEAAIAGVLLELVDAAGNPVDSDPVTTGVQPTTVTTDANGNWYISSATGTDATGVNYGVALLPNTVYKVRLATTGAGNDWDPTANGGAGGPRAGGDLVGFNLTKSNSVGAGQAEFSDNDAILTASVPEITVTTGDFGQNDHTLDFGFTKLASLGNKVWLDEGAGGGIPKDGIQNGTEPGVSGVVVMLYQNGPDGVSGNDDDVLVGSTITDSYGMYMFNNLQPSTGASTQYNVRVTPPANYSLTTQTNLTDDNITTGPSTTGSDVNVLGVSYSIDLSAGENNPNIDAGLIIKAQAIPNSIGDKVWFDADGNGVNANNAAEPGVAGVTVTLFDAATGNIVAVTTTDANGNYLFNNVPANTNFQVGFSAPAGTVLTTGGTLDITNGSTNSDPSPTTGKTATFSSGPAGTQITGVDAGLKNDPKGAIGDFVWNDINNNGIQDVGEPGVPGVLMTLYNVGPDGIRGNADDGTTLTTTTDANGYYVFPNLDPSKYVVTATPIAGYALSPKDVTASNPGGDAKDSDFSAGTGLFAGSYVSPVKELKPIAGGVTRDMTIDLGIYNSTANLNSLGDKVWNDVNKDGLQTAGEAGVPNVTVRLLNSVGAAVNNPATGKPYVVVTDAAGMYRFVDLPDGEYIVEFANIPAGYSFTGQDKDVANQGLPGSATDGATDSDAKTTTGRTVVIAIDPTSVNPVSVNILTVDAGITQGIPSGTASLGNRVWYDNGRDANGAIVGANANNGKQDVGELGVANVKVELLDAFGVAVDSDPNIAGVQPYVVYTNALGEYLFTGLPAGDYTVKFSRFPTGYTSSAANTTGVDDALDADASFAGSSVLATTTATTAVYTLQTGEDNLTVDMGIIPAAGTNSIGNFVWSDLGATPNGKQDAGEPGVAGVTVTLYNNGADGLPGTADDVLVAVTTTDNNGAYGFVGLADGNYNVGFTNLPAGFSYTDKDKAGSTTADGSDANVNSGRTGTYALDPASSNPVGVNEPNVDGGIISTRAALGNFVWLDTNGDGIQDASEKGVSGVTVILYASDGTTVLASTITDADGKYYFGNLIPGNYRVGFSDIPTNLTFTKQNTAGDNSDNTNSDAVPATPTATTAITGVINLVAGETDLTVDAGLKPNNPASVGDLVWNDIDGDGVQDANEPGIPGIIVTLKDNLGNVVGTAITDGNGAYLISNVTPGTGFTITFSNLPATAIFTTQTSNVTTTDATLGSDANTATGVTATFNLVAGQYLPHVDAGIKNVQVLPIKIESFTAVPKGSQVNLQWKVSEQINVTSYEVLTSTDARTFTSIATVTATANQSDIYNAIHNNPVQGLNYYRIKSIDKDGTISYSEIRKVTFGKGGDVIIYPNPVQTGVINITLTGNMIGKSATVSIVSMDGKLISQQQIANTNQTETIDVSKLASGSYIVRLITNTEVVNKTIQVIR
jgi:SdrD B-like domain/Secretion system C-terminal sorting domain